MSKNTAKVATPRSYDVEKELLRNLNTINISDILQNNSKPKSTPKSFNALKVFNQFFLKAVTR